MIYSIVLITAIQESNSVIHICVYLKILFSVMVIIGYWIYFSLLYSERIMHYIQSWCTSFPIWSILCILSPFLFKLYAEYIMWDARLDEQQDEIKTARRNIDNLRYADDTTLLAEREEELKSLLMKVKEESEKAGLKLNIQKTKIMASGPITLWQIDGETVTGFIFIGSKITADGDFSHEIKRCLLLGRKAINNPDSILKSRDITLLTKARLVKAMFFSSSHTWMWELDHKEGWVPKNWCFWTVVLEKILENPLDCKEIQPVHPKDQSWIFIGRTDAEAEAPILWPPDVKNWFIRKDPDAGKHWRQEEKQTTEDETVGRHHWLDGHEV